MYFCTKHTNFDKKSIEHISISLWLLLAKFDLVTKVAVLTLNLSLAQLLILHKNIEVKITLAHISTNKSLGGKQYSPKRFYIPTIFVINFFNFSLCVALVLVTN